ncbi:unnamed protein product [Phaedon cochleariae]|uniref:Uncharacterized protein n=1 Tax=Phaedon cochleariae TaxID=80249 RepID=A0A9P0DXC2_PHACE|nr:unnamed protein product [Phaedon cochleariae]
MSCFLLKVLFLCVFILGPGDATRDQGIIDNPKSGGKFERNTKTVCNSTSCKDITSQLLFLMNHDVDPCVEFPEYVCGNQGSLKDPFSDIFESFEIFLGSNVTDKSEKYRRDFRDFYQSCLHFQKDFGFLDTLEFLLKQNYSSVTDILIEVILRQSFPFFEIGLDIDVDTAKYVFQITLPGESVLKTNTDGWSLREQIKNQCRDNLQDSLNSNEMNLNEIHADFRKCENEMLRKYIENYGKNMKFVLNINDTEDLLTELLGHQQAIQVPEEEIWQAKIHENFTQITITEMNNKYDMINWTQFFEGITTNTTFSGNEIVHVYFPDYLEKVFIFFKTLEERKLIRMLQEFSSLELYKNLLQPYGNTKRAFCMSLVSQLMPDVASIIFYDKNPIHKTFSSVFQTRNLFNKLKNQLNESIEQSTLDEDSKLAFEHKLGKLELGLIPSGNFNATKDNYRDLSIGPDFQENLVRVMRNYRKIIFSHVGTKASAASLLNYFVSPFQDIPKTFYTSDTIVLHPGIFSRVPSDLPDYIIVAKLGLLMSQEILRHFDPTGRLFMTNGVRSSDEKYKVLVESTRNLMNSFYLKNPINYHQKTVHLQKINGDHLLNELISDNAAFRLLTDYYGTLGEQKQMPWIRDGFTAEQVFLIAATQEFCGIYSEVDLMRDLLERGRLPFPIKIQNMVSNSAFFAESFECPVGSEMSFPPELMIQFPYIPEIDDDMIDNYEQGPSDDYYDQKDTT